MKTYKVYVAGKVSKDSVFGTHYWRDEFVKTLESLSGTKLVNVDPTKTGVDNADPTIAFECDAYMISQVDVLIVYLSDDISIGGSQEILLAKYFKKPVIGLAPLGGKFNGRTKEYFGKIVENYRDPFAFTTCDIVCPDIEGVADALKNVDELVVKDIGLIGVGAERFGRKELPHNPYLQVVLGDSKATKPRD